MPDPKQAVDERIQKFLDYLNRLKMRATYGAVGDALGIPARSVGAMLGTRRPEASWVVNAKTNEPTGYAESELHPELRRNPSVITSGASLLRGVAGLESNDKSCD